LLIIAKGPEVAVYVNNKPLTYFRDDSLSSGVIRIGMNPLVPNTEVEFDNVRFWNLDNVPGLP